MDPQETIQKALEEAMTNKEDMLPIALKIPPEIMSRIRKRTHPPWWLSLSFGLHLMRNIGVLR